jgi:hypothetical protein
VEKLRKRANGNMNPTADHDVLKLTRLDKAANLTL